MERLFDRLWSSYGDRYRWAVVGALGIASVGAILAPTMVVFVAYFGLRDAWVVPVCWAVTMPVLLIGLVGGMTGWDSVEAWARGERSDPVATAKVAFGLSRAFLRRFVALSAVGVGLILPVSVAVVEDDWTTRLEWLVAGLSQGVVTAGIGMHFAIDVWFQPLRRELATASPAVGTLPPPGRSYLTAVSLMVLSTALAFSVLTAWITVHLDAAERHPLVPVGVALALAVIVGVPNTVMFCVAPALRPIRDLTDGVARIQHGDTSVPVPVTTDDDLGTLAAQFNLMQAGLTEREQLHAAFGSYVDPTLARRILEQGSDVFAGERRDVTVMFIDIRDFTPFSEANTAETTVAHLNALFEMVVPTVVAAGGHVNKFLGDGAMAVFGAPNELPDHADAAIAVATDLQRLVTARFDGALRIGIGINTGTVIAGTIGGGGKLEYTLIGDAVNVAARVEQLTKAVGDPILLTQHTVDASTRPPPDLTDHGEHQLKGKSTPIRLHGLTPAVPPD